MADYCWMLKRESQHKGTKRKRQPLRRTFEEKKMYCLSPRLGAPRIFLMPPTRFRVINSPVLTRGLKKSNNGKNTNNGNKPSKPDEYMHGAGVGLYIRDTIKWREIRKSAIKNMNETEYIIVELHGLNGDRILVASAYRRPKGRCLADFFEVLFTVSESYSDVIIKGDLNSDLSATDVNEDGRDLEKLFEENSYYPVPFGPTHHQARLRADPVTGQRTLRESHT
ncbi:unnamed protein product [Trichogramma brassicae]|uniref:Endonuclease/exonuclease/phosphatase domain-containing protein n=1 Tax=Trichogramma brassicae TaxID=86971 RepID=A0A6H5IFS2_9HYME|nr:unnamed protein product [Trichogramma brassicae]